jgi:hypothetical protein
MQWRKVSTETVWQLHLASGRQLGAAIVGAFNNGLEPHIIATKTAAGAKSVTVLGVAADGTTRTFVEVELRDDEDAAQAHENLRLDDVIEGARATLAYVDQVQSALREGKPLPPRRDTRRLS